MKLFLEKNLFVILLVLGIAIRCIGIERPLLDSHNIRQCHTAILTQNLVEDGFPWIKTRGSWNGFEDSTVVLEMPIQMHLAGRIYQFTGNMDAAGRAVTIFFWAIAFWQFNMLCGRLLNHNARRWSAIIFSISPISIFFGQSFQPETIMVAITLSILNGYLSWIASGVRTEDEKPLRYADLKLARQYFHEVEHHEFWLTTLALFLKYYFIDRTNPNEVRYWKRIYSENRLSLRWWMPLLVVDNLLTKTPLIRWLAWNIVMTGVKP